MSESSLTLEILEVFGGGIVILYVSVAGYNIRSPRFYFVPLSLVTRSPVAQLGLKTTGSADIKTGLSWGLITTTRRRTAFGPRERERAWSQDLGSLGGDRTCLRGPRSGQLGCTEFPAPTCRPACRLMAAPGLADGDASCAAPRLCSPSRTASNPPRTPGRPRAAPGRGQASETNPLEPGCAEGEAAAC